MTRISISLPDAAKRRIDRHAIDCGFENASDFLGNLIKRGLSREPDELEKALIEGLNSGPATEMTEKDWEGIHREIDRQGKRRVRKAP